MKTSNYKDIEKIREELRPWLKKRKIPLQNFDNLPLYQKFWLHGVAYIGDVLLSDAQLRTLYQNLVLGKRRTWQGSQIGPATVELIEYEELKKFFTPLSRSEKLLELYKY
jgi:hypothetical protein